MKCPYCNKEVQEPMSNAMAWLLVGFVVAVLSLPLWFGGF